MNDIPPSPGLYDGKGNPISENSPGVLRTTEMRKVSPAIAGGLVVAAGKGLTDLAINAADALENIAAGDQASGHS
ncbi:MAG TPA: hypothetical protein PKU78_00865 [Candidatus Dojkabacteria bacterium]|nr:hypothetical protein [Candidatus Dojkabacteria bacterium]HRO64752.1 hypothetical protein [Candidatus Dojkabacteria bacterium]HRP51229.1 hypothetical protein [Candidatus Dojkabacteria bacterium]